MCLDVAFVQNANMYIFLFYVKQGHHWALSDVRTHISSVCFQLHTKYVDKTTYTDKLSKLYFEQQYPLFLLD